MPTTIHYSDGSARPSVITIREDLSTEQSNMLRAFWSDEPDGEGGGSPVIGYCSPGGSHRHVRDVVAEVRRLYPDEEIWRNGRRIA